MGKRRKFESPKANGNLIDKENQPKFRQEKQSRNIGIQIQKTPETD